MSALVDVRQLATSGALEDAREALRQTTAARLQVAGEHREWGLLAEELGLVGVAEREFNLALRDDPDDRVALEHLVELALERGNLERAVNLLTRRVDLDPQDLTNTQRLIDLLLDVGAEPRAHQLAQRARSLGLDVHLAGSGELAAAAEDEEELTPLAPSLVASDADCARFLATFGGREDVYARQWFNPKTGQGGYAPVREPLTPRVLRQHFAGDVTLGVYPIRLDGTCLFCAIDLDLQRSVLAEAQRHRDVAQRVRQELAQATAFVCELCGAVGLRPVVEDSGYKGRHFWLPLAEPLHAGRLVALGKALLARLQAQLPPTFALEWFPKAARAGSKGLGNLIKLPLGIHRRTGRRSTFLDDQGQPLARPFELLRTHPRVDEPGLTAALTALGGQAVDAEPAELVEPSRGVAVAPVSQPPPVVDSAPRPFTVADLERHPAYRRLFQGCAVLAALRDKAIHQRHLSHDELVVLAHSLGYMPSGVAAFNYLLGLCPGAPAGALLKSPLRGNPISCPKIRARIGHITATVPCNCVFPTTSETYPHPLLHLHGLSADELAPLPPLPPPEAQVRRLLILRHRIHELQAEAQALADELIAQLRASPALRWELPEGVLALEAKDGIPELVWIPAAGENHGPTGRHH